MKKVLQFSAITCCVLALSGCGGSDGSSTNGAEGFQSGDTWNGLVYETVTSPYTGRVWLDRNLGASQVCTDLNDTACYGDYYQWGRKSDGHEKSDSNTTEIQATDIANAGTDYITDSTAYYGYEWAQAADNNGSLRSTQWSKTDGTSVCPVGFRVPTVAEFAAETTDEGMADNAEAFTNFLKLPSAGYRNPVDGLLYLQGYYGSVWSMTVSSTYFYMSDALYFGNSYAGTYYFVRGYGRSVRCIED